MLAIGAAVLGAVHVVAVDIDPDALRLAQENVAGIFDENDDEPSPVRCREVEGDDQRESTSFPTVVTIHFVLQIDFMRADIRELVSQQPRLSTDTVIMNPPFGTRQKGADGGHKAKALL